MCVCECGFYIFIFGVVLLTESETETESNEAASSINSTSTTLVNGNAHVYIFLVNECIVSYAENETAHTLTHFLHSNTGCSCGCAAVHIIEELRSYVCISFAI